jgi:hypothetical protein
MTWGFALLITLAIRTLLVSWNGFANFLNRLVFPIFSYSKRRLRSGCTC